MPDILEYNDPHSPSNAPRRKLERFLTRLGKKKALNLAVLSFAALMLPIALIAVQQQTNIKQQASSTQVVFVDANNQAITQTTSPSVKVKLTSPYGVITGMNNDEMNHNEITMGDSEVDYQTVLGTATATYQVSASTDDLNEVNGLIDPMSPSNATGLWLGNAESTTASYTGMRFTNITIPKGASITSAKLAVHATDNSWIQMKFQIAGQASGNSQTFSSLSRPSQRPLTTAKVSHSSNAKWSVNNWYALNEMNTVLQEIVNRPDWQSGNSVSIILKGTGKQYARKIVRSFDAGAATAPKLLVTYSTPDGVTPQPTTIPTATPTSVPTNIPTVTPTLAPVLTATPIPPTATTAPIVTTQSITLAEDPNFTTNVKTISPVTSNPTFTDYTFSNTTAGEKLLFAKFTSSTGESQIFSSSITLTQIAQNPTPTGMVMNGESMAMMGWRVGGKNAPNPAYDKCDDGTDVVAAHNQYYVIAYDGIKYPTWHPPVVTNPITDVGKCYFGHEHGTNPQNYMYWDEMVQHFGKDINGDGTITKLSISSEGVIAAGDRAGIPFGIANDHMDKYYNQEGRDSLFVRHEDHVGHKIELVNNESEMVGNTTHPMSQLAGTNGTNIPYYTTGSDTFQPTGVTCTHLHKFHQGSSSADAVRNNLHEVIFHSRCQSVNTNNINAPAYYPDNTVLLTGMMAFGKPGEYLRFCFADRSTKVCPDGKNADGSCVINDPLISKLPPAINSTSLGRNMVDKACLENWTTLNPGNNYFGPYELWEGDLRIQTASGDMLAEHGRQWDILDPIRFVDVGYQHPTRTWQKDYQFNSENCKKPGGAYDQLTYVGGCASRDENVAWDSTQSGFKGLKRTTYFGRNRVSNPGGSEIVWTDPLGGNAVPNEFPSGLKQKITTVEADIQDVQYRVQQLFGNNHFLNDRAIQRRFNDGGGAVHAPN